MTPNAATPRRNARRPPEVVNRIVLALLRSRLHGMLDPGMCELRYRGRHSGRVRALPVIYAQNGEQLVVVVGGAQAKQWWRNFTAPGPVEVRRGGQLRTGTCRVVAPDDPAYEPAWRAYVERQHVSHQSDDRLLVIEFGGSQAPARDSTTTA